MTAAITAGSSPPACQSSCQPPQQLSAIRGRMASSQNHSNSAEVTTETPPWKQQATYSMCLRACKRFHFLIRLPCYPSLAFKMQHGATSLGEMRQRIRIQTCGFLQQLLKCPSPQCVEANVTFLKPHKASFSHQNSSSVLDENGGSRIRAWDLRGDDLQ